MVAPDFPRDRGGSGGPVLDSHPERNLGIAADLPIVMLPVRVETRWFVVDATRLELRIRIYPDDLHIPQLHPVNAAEHDEGVAYWRARIAEGEASESAERERRRLVRRAGESRTAFVIRACAPVDGAFPVPPETRAPAPIIARALPARFVAVGFVGNRRAFEVSSTLIPVELPVIPFTGDDDGESALPNEARWLHDFAAAERVGMAIRVTVANADAHALDELIVIGTPSTNSDRDSTTLGDLLAMHATNTAAFMVPGTASNRVGAEAVVSPRAIGTPPPLGSDGAELARALGVEQAALQDVAGAHESTARWARAMNTALWSSTWGYYLDVQIGALDDGTIRAGRSHFIQHVRPGGVFPALRLGAQPYGVLPTCAWSVWPATNASDAWLANYLRNRARGLQARTSTVPRVVGEGDVDGAFERILATPPWSTGVIARGVHAPDAVEASSGGGWLDFSNLQDYLDEIEDALDAAPWIVAGFPAIPALHAMIYDDKELDVRAPMVGADGAYLAALANASIEDLRAHRVSAPRTLLYVLARAAVLLADLNLADAVLATPRAVRRGRVQGESVSRRLARASTIPLTHVPIERNERDQVRSALQLLASAPVAVLDHALAGVVDAASHRLDAWMTSLATKRLATLRATEPRSAIGAWCWLERPRPRAPITNVDIAMRGAGYLHAPSIGQARTAAILRAGFEAHRDDVQSSSVQLDLSSGRVRAAHEILDGVRAGQPLGVVLGYRIERLVHVAGADRFIDDLRAAFPRDDDGGVPTLVVDGWKAHERWRTALPPEPELEAVALQIANELDGVADVLLAEAVHQTARGNPTRAGAALGNLDRGDSAVIEPHVVATPAGASATTSRVLLALPTASGWPGDDKRARPLAAPGISAWASSVLGPPHEIRMTVRTAERTLAWSAVDFDLSALDVVAWSEHGGAPLRELCAAIATRMLGAPATIADGPGFADAIARASTLQRVMRDARPASPRDVGRAEVAPVLGGVSSALADVLTDLAAGARTGALLALVGPAADPVAALAALHRRSSADLALAVLGDSVPRAGTIVTWPATSARLASAAERAMWLADHARVRPALEALDLLALIAPAAVGEGVALASVGTEILVFGAAPRPGGDAIVIDAFSTSPASAELSTGVAVHQDSPRARAPQSILIAVTPPSKTWTLDLLETTIRDTIELARLRMLDPHQVHDHYLPALHLADELDTETIGTRLFDLDLVNTLVSQ